jgi:arylsulfatase A-like enzyme
MEHTELLKKLANECESIGVTLYEHGYNYQAFGSWSVTLGRPHHRMHFSWDGKESYLGIGEAEFTNSNSRSNWEPVFPSMSGTQVSPEEVFGFIYKKVGERYGT